MFFYTAKYRDYTGWSKALYQSIMENLKGNTAKNTLLYFISCLFSTSLQYNSNF